VNHDKSILGIHIDDDFLNIVHLTQTKNGLHVHNRTIEPIGVGMVKDGLIIDEQALSQIIRNFVKSNQIKSCKAIMLLPSSTVRLKPSEFPAQTDKQLQKQVEDQVEKYSLFEGQEVVFDYCTFEETAQSSNKQTVLQAVTTRQMSDACLTVAHRGGLDLVRIEPAVMPMIKLGLHQQATVSETVSLLLALDSASGNLSVFKNSVPKVFQNLSVGTKDLSQGKDGFTRLTEQMRPVLEYAHSIADSQQYTLRVVAACNSGKLEAIVSQIRQSLSDVTVEQIEYSQIAKQFDVQGTDGGEVPFFALASALTALGVCEYDGKLNLISQESLTRQKTKKEMSLTAKVIVVIVLLSIAVLIPLKMKTKSVEAASSEVEAKVAETIPMREKITGLKRQIKHLKEKQAAYDAVSKELIDTPWPKVMQTIGDTMPDKVRIVDISTTDSGDFTLFGETLAERCIYKFVKGLQNNELVESAKVEEIEYDDNSDVILVNYKIKCKVRMP